MLNLRYFIHILAWQRNMLNKRSWAMTWSKWWLEERRRRRRLPKTYSALRYHKWNGIYIHRSRCTLICQSTTTFKETRIISSLFHTADVISFIWYSFTAKDILVVNECFMVRSIIFLSFLMLKLSRHDMWRLMHILLHGRFASVHLYDLLDLWR